MNVLLVGPALFLRLLTLLCRLMGSPRLVDWLRLADARLADREWLADELSIADFALYPVTVVRRSSIERIGGLPRLERWQRALAARPGVARGMAAAEPDR